MNKQNVYVVIMAGGIGSRFWPASREKHPKQFLDILSLGKSLLRMTYDRMLSLCDPGNIYIVTNESYKELVKEQLDGIDDSQILGEPTRRNTAPCIAYVSHKIAALNPNASMIVAPSDHLVTDEATFQETLEKALNFIEKKDSLITLGIRPTGPNTGYGYIQFREDIEKDGIYKIKTFTEKPTLEIAKEFLKSGDFLWNSGIFVWSSRSILKAFNKYQPEMYDVFQEGMDLYNTPEEKAFIERAYSQCTNLSIDYGIMEHASNVNVIPADFGWSDLGTWTSLYELYEKDYLGNAVKGNQVNIYDSTNNIVMGPDNKLVVLQGLDDFIVIETDDVLLICKKSDEQQIKQITSDIKRKKGNQYL